MTSGLPRAQKQSLNSRPLYSSTEVLAKRSHHLCCFLMFSHFLIYLFHFCIPGVKNTAINEREQNVDPSKDCLLYVYWLRSKCSAMELNKALCDHNELQDRLCVFSLRWPFSLLLSEYSSTFSYIKAENWYAFHLHFFSGNNALQMDSERLLFEPLYVLLNNSHSETAQPNANEMSTLAVCTPTFVSLINEKKKKITYIMSPNILRDIEKAGYTFIFI